MNTLDILNQTKAVAAQLSDIMSDELIDFKNARANECFLELDTLYKGIKPIKLDDTDFVDKQNAVVYMSRKRGKETRVDELNSDELLGVIAYFVKEAKSSLKDRSGSRYYLYLKYIENVFNINKKVDTSQKFEISKSAYLDDLFNTAFKNFNEATSTKLYDLVVACIDSESSRIRNMLAIAKKEKTIDHHYILQNLSNIVKRRINLNDQLSFELMGNLKSIYAEYVSAGKPQSFNYLLAKHDLENNTKENSHLYNLDSSAKALSIMLNNDTYIQKKHLDLFKKYLDQGNNYKVLNSDAELTQIEELFKEHNVSSIYELLHVKEASMFRVLNISNLNMLDLTLKFSPQLEEIWDDLSDINKVNLLYLYDQIDKLKTLVPDDIWFEKTKCPMRVPCAERFLSDFIPSIDDFVKSVSIYKTLSNTQILGPSEYKSLLDTHLVDKIESITLPDFNN